MNELERLRREHRDLLAANKVLRAQAAAAKAIRDAGVEITRRVVVPQGISDKAAVNEYIGLFDGPLQRAFDAALPPWRR